MASPSSTQAETVLTGVDCAGYGGPVQVVHTSCRDAQRATPALLSVSEAMALVKKERARSEAEAEAEAEAQAPESPFEHAGDTTPAGRLRVLRYRADLPVSAAASVVNQRRGPA